MPPRGSVREAKEFAQKHGGWIAARLRRLPEAAPFADGTVLPLRGVQHRIVHRAGVRGTVWAEPGEGGEALLCVAGEAPHIDRRVVDFLRREALRDLDTASRRAAEKLGVTIKRISVRDQSSRWGSCSTTGLLSYSWRLILAPPFVLDYLAVHEVAHLIEMNHSPRFWRLVHGVCADAGRAKAWLDVHGTDLHRFGVPGRRAPASRAAMLAPRFLRADVAARHAGRLRPAVGRHVPGVAAVDGPAAERTDLPGATDDLGLSGRLRRRAGVLRSAVGPPWPAAGAARGARHLSGGDGGLRDGVFHRDADRRALRAGGRRLRRERAGARHRARHVRGRPHRPRAGADGVDHGVGATGGAVDRRRVADGVRLAVEFRCAVLLLRGGLVDDLGAAAGDRAPARARAGVVRLDLPVLSPLPRRPGLCRPSRHRDLLPVSGCSPGSPARPSCCRISTGCRRSPSAWCSRSDRPAIWSAPRSPRALS